MSTELLPRGSVGLTERIAVIDADSHVMEPPDLWLRRLDGSRWGDRIPRVQFDARSNEERWYIGGHRASGVASFAFTGWGEFPPSHPRSVDDADPAAWDPHKRLERLDEYGIQAQVLYPNLLGFSSVFFLDIDDVALRNECVLAYNDFLVDFVSVDPNRLIPLMWLPFWDVELSVREIERCVSRGHHGIIMPSNFAPVGLPALQDEHWHPIWASAQTHGLSVNFHTGFQTSSDEARQALGRRATRIDFAKTSALFMLGNARTVADLVLYGVCHRFPKLTFVSVESGFGWMPYFAELLDWQYLNSGAREVDDVLDRLPSDYLREQVCGTFWFERDSLSQLAHLYPDTAMFSTDFPHPTSLTPGPASYSDHPARVIDANLGTIDDVTVRKLLRDNAARVYHID